MGYYFAGSATPGKGDELVRLGAREITRDEARQLLVNEAVFCVANNGAFEAAALIYSVAEFDDFAAPDDARPKRWYAMADQERGYKLANYKPLVGELAQAFADRFEAAAKACRELEVRAQKDQ